VKRGTLVKNPTARAGLSGFVACTYCNRHYTHLGISRHCDKCPDNPFRRRGTAVLKTMGVRLEGVIVQPLHDGKVGVQWTDGTTDTLSRVYLTLKERAAP
jgi:hypothetical protein